MEEKQQKIEQPKEKDWEPIEPNVWKAEKDGDSIQGVLVAKKENVGANESNAYIIGNETGQFFVWGATILDDRMLMVNTGETIRITYKGKTKNKRGQDTKIFKVERAKP